MVKWWEEIICNGIFLICLLSDATTTKYFINAHCLKSKPFFPLKMHIPLELADRRIRFYESMIENLQQLPDLKYICFIDWCTLFLYINKWSCRYWGYEILQIINFQSKNARVRSGANLMTKVCIIWRCFVFKIQGL